MKSLSKLLLGFMALSLTFTGCKKDEPTISYLQAGDVTATLTQGNLIYYGSESDEAGTFYVYYLELYSQGMDLGTDNSGFPTYSGSGVKILVSLYSKGTPRPANGDDYVYHEWSPAHNALNNGAYSLDYIAPSKASYKGIVSGTLTVKKHTGDNFTITFSGKDEDNGDVEIEYTGNLKYYDGSQWVSKK